MAITKEQFADPKREGWWLVAAQVDPRLDIVRRDLGEALEFGYDEWYTESGKLEAVYDWLSANNSRLLDELDDQALAADAERQTKWVADVISARAPEPIEAPGAPASSAPALAVQPAPVTSEPPAKKSLFAKKAPPVEEASESVSEETSESITEEASISSPPAAETPAEAPKKSLFAKKATPESEPAQAPSADEVSVEAATEVIEQANLSEEVKNDLEAYIADPNIPVSPQEVADLIKEFPDDLEKQFEEAKQDLDQELESFLAELEDAVEE